MRLLYTPQIFLEDVRRLIVAQADLTTSECYVLCSTPIEYKPIAQHSEYTVERAEEIAHHSAHAEQLFGETSYHLNDVYHVVQIFGCDHGRNQRHMAFSVIHELAHAITVGFKHNHDEVWAANARRLGICEVPYDGDNKQIDTKLEKDKWAFTNLTLQSAIEALPVVEWGNLDWEAYELINEQLGIMEGDIIRGSEG